MGGVVANQAFVIGLPSPVIVNTSVEMVARVGVDVVSVNIIEFAVSGSGGVAKGVTVIGVGNKLGIGLALVWGELVTSPIWLEASS